MKFNNPKKANNKNFLEKIDIVELKNLFYIYKDEKIDVVANKDVNITFKKGTINIIMGPSGSGKTTFLQIIGGLLSPSSGTLKINDIDISELNEADKTQFRRKKVGFIFQNNNLLPQFTVEQNIELVHSVYQEKYSKNKKLELSKIIEKFDLSNRTHHYPSELSGGQIQKAGIIVALCHNPDIILADEPSGDLDTKSRDKLMEIFLSIKQMSAEKIIIIATHDPTFLNIADNAVFLENGTIISKLTKKELLKSRSIPLNDVKDSGNEKSTFLNENLNLIKKNAEEIVEKIRNLKIMKDF